MDLTTPPFDDVHVRKAMNLVMDLEGVQRAWGGPVQGSTPTDVLPDTMMPELTAENYTPYQKPPFAGDVEAAKAEMKQSKYDTDKDGLCDAPACKGIVHLNRNFAAVVDAVPDHRAVGRQDRHRAGRRARPRARRSTTRRAQPGREDPDQLAATAGPRTTPTRPPSWCSFDGRNILADGNPPSPSSG